MLKLLADENFDNTIVRGLLRRRLDIDIVRVQDAKGQQHLALIENKIKAPAQPEQFERYVQRGLRYVELERFSGDGLNH